MEQTTNAFLENNGQRVAGARCTNSLIDRAVLAALMTHRPLEQLSAVVSRESIEALIPPAALLLDGSEGSTKCQERYDANRAFLVDRLTKRFEGYEHAMTFTQVQSTVEKAWPAVSASGLSALRNLARFPSVSQDQVRQALRYEFFGLADHCTTKQKTSLNRVVSCLFYAPIGGEAPTNIPGMLILDILNAIRDGDVDDESLAEDFAAHQVDTRRAVSSFLFFVYLCVGLVSLVVSLRVWDAYVLGSATAPTFNWMNYCEPGGPMSECHFDQRTFASIATYEDALRFVRVELPTNLWSSANGGPASDVPYGTAWYIGGLSVRVAPTTDAAAVPFTCGQLNLTKPYSLTVTSQVFSCGALSYVTVPFAANLSTALAALGNFTIVAPFQDVTVVAAYALFMPSNGYTVFQEAAMTFLRSGAVITRTRQHISSPIMADAIFSVFIMYTVFSVVEEALLLTSKLRRMPVRVSLLQYIPKVVAFVAMVFAFVSVVTSDGVSDWLQTSGFTSNIDTRAASDQRAQYGFGVFALAILCNACSYLKSFESVDLVVQLVAKSVAPLLSITLVFGFNFITLVLMAMFIFGVNQIEFSTFVYAIRNTFPFLFGAGDPDVFTSEYATLGYYYYAVFSIFVSFIVMNVFVGVLMAPLGSLSSSASQLCYTALLSATVRQRDVHKDQKALLKIGYQLLPTLNLLKDAMPFPDFNWSVVYNLLSLHSTQRDRVAAARKIYTMVDAGGVAEWRQASRLLRMVERKWSVFQMSETSLALCLVVMAYESKFNAFRDARLLRLILFHDASNLHQNQTFAAEEPEVEIEEEQEETEQATEATSVAAIESEMGVVDGSAAASSMRSLINRAAGSSIDVSYSFVNHIHDTLFAGGIMSAPAATFLLFLVEIGLIVGYYLYIFIVVTSVSHETAFFTEDLHSGLRDGQYTQACNDPQCQSATTSPSSFTTNSQFSDLQAFLTRLLIPSLYVSLDDLPYSPAATIPINGTTPVRWSAVPRLQSVTIRQLRGQPTPCKPFPGLSPNTSSNFARQTIIDSFLCYSDDEWASSPIPRPADSPLDAAAYVNQHACPSEVNSFAIKGFQYSFPCQGYIAIIQNASQLAYAASTWLNDPSVKFIAIGLVFQHAPPTGEFFQAWYNLYAQLGMGGAQGEFWVTVTQKNSPLMQQLATSSFYFLCSNVALVLVILVVQVLLRCAARKSSAVARFSLYAEIAHTFPVMTVWMFLVCGVVFVVEFPSKKWANVAAACLVALYFNIKVVAMIVLPLAGVLSRRGTTIPRMGVLVIRRFFIVAPFIAIFWVAFALGGNVTWGASVVGYSTISKSFSTVSHGFLGGWDFGSIEDVFPGLAMMVTGVFFISVLVVLLPTLLSLIVQSAEDANDELSITNALCGLADETDSLVLFGPLARILLSVWCLAKASAQTRGGGFDDDSDGVAVSGDGEAARLDRTPVAFTRIGRAAMMPLLKATLRAIGRPSLVLHEQHGHVAYTPSPSSVGQHQQQQQPSSSRNSATSAERLYFDESWRMPMAIECLLPYLGPIQIAQLREMLHYDDLRLSMKYTAVAFLLMQYKQFKRRNSEQAAEDAAKEKKQCNIYASVDASSDGGGLGGGDGGSGGLSAIQRIFRASSKSYSPVESTSF